MNDLSRLGEAAELVQKLHLIAQELPTTEPKYERAKKRVESAYNKVEGNLIEGFLKAYKDGEASISHIKQLSFDKYITQYTSYPYILLLTRSFTYQSIKLRFFCIYMYPLSLIKIFTIRRLM